VDGGSSDATLAIASRYATQILSKRGPLGLARQIGCQLASGGVLGIFDSDIELPHPDWLQKAIALFCSHSRLGILWPKNMAPPNASLVTRAYFHLWEAFQQTRRTQNELPGGNSLILRRSFDDVGGFDSRIQWGEDFDLTRRIIANGFEIAIYDDPIFHNSMRTLHEFISKQIRAASFLSQVNRRDTILGRQLLVQSMTWSASRQHEPLVKLAIEHGIVAIKCSVAGSLRTRDPSWLLIPLLMMIRVLAYLPYARTLTRVGPN
jgi:glycosyltransferase involved in cell wall biosynthesis